jgi:hypothetical protein
MAFLMFRSKLLAHGLSGVPAFLQPRLMLHSLCREGTMYPMMAVSNNQQEYTDEDMKDI